MPQTFSDSNISFLYPDNWTLDDEQKSGGEGGLTTVYSPGGAFWSLSIHPPSAEPEQLAEAAVEAMREEYPRTEEETFRQVVEGHEMSGYDLAFYYLDLTSSAFVRSFRTPEAAYVIFYQAEDGELQTLDQVFAAITKSFLDSLD